MNHFLRRLFASFSVVGFVFSAALLARANEVPGRVKVVRVAKDAKVMKAALGADSAIHVLLNAEDGPRYVKSIDGGITFGAPISIVDASLRKQGLKFQAEDL